MRRSSNLDSTDTAISESRKTFVARACPSLRAKKKPVSTPIIRFPGPFLVSFLPGAETGRADGFEEFALGLFPLFEVKLGFDRGPDQTRDGGVAWSGLFPQCLQNILR